MGGSSSPVDLKDVDLPVLEKKCLVAMFQFSRNYLQKLATLNVIVGPFGRVLYATKILIAGRVMAVVVACAGGVHGGVECTVGG